MVLDAFTTAGDPEDVHFLLLEANDIAPLFFKRARIAATRMFGGTRQRLLVTGATGDVYEHRWTMKPGQIDDALALMKTLEPLPSYSLGEPLTLGIEARFHLKKPDSGDVLPLQGQDAYGGQEANWKLPLGESSLYLRLATRSTCFLFLSMPFPDPTSDVQAYVTQLQSALPFRLSPKQWARWQLNAQRTRYYKCRITLPPSRGA
jgi:hypothetical protein